LPFKENEKDKNFQIFIYIIEKEVIIKKHL